MAFFAFVIITLMIAFGIAMQSTIPIGNEFNFKLFKDIINNAYWSIYGQMDVLACINGEDDNCDNGTFPNYVSKDNDLLNYDFILLIAYTIILLILLNVLIAQFK